MPATAYGKNIQFRLVTNKLYHGCLMHRPIYGAAIRIHILHI